MEENNDSSQIMVVLLLLRPIVVENICCISLRCVHWCRRRRLLLQCWARVCKMINRCTKATNSCSWSSLIGSKLIDQCSKSINLTFQLLCVLGCSYIMNTSNNYGITPCIQFNLLIRILNLSANPPFVLYCCVRLEIEALNENVGRW